MTWFSICIRGFTFEEFWWQPRPSPAPQPSIPVTVTPQGFGLQYLQYAEVKWLGWNFIFLIFQVNRCYFGHQVRWREPTCTHEAPQSRGEHCTLGRQSPLGPSALVRRLEWDTCRSLKSLQKASSFPPQSPWWRQQQASHTHVHRAQPREAGLTMWLSHLPSQLSLWGLWLAFYARGVMYCVVLVVN